MKIAYLIAAYDNPAHFGRLLDGILTPNSAAFVHIDAKSVIDPFVRFQRAGVHFAKTRNKVYWGDFSFIEAVLRMMREALDSAERFEYLALISGTDYPIRPIAELERFLAAHRGAQFMNMVPMPNDSMGKPISRLERYKPRGGNRVEKVYSLIRDVLVRAKLMSGRRDYESALGPMRPYGGSTWWVITREAAEYIVDFMNKNPRFVRFYQNTWLPEEGMFQTILANSHFATGIRRNLLYTDWRQGGRHPKLIGQEHVLRFLGSEPITPDDRYGAGELFFARKFNDAAGPLVEALRAHFQQKASVPHRHN